MAKYESSVKVIPYSQETVFSKLENLENLEKLRERIPQEYLDKIENLQFSKDSLSIGIQPIGEMTLKIIEREEPKCIKFETDNMPAKVNLWIQLLPVSETSCKMKLTLKADVPPFLLSMVGSKIQQMLDAIADTLAIIPYE
ncbi:MAG: SRPBCC family protein [Prevotella sp.]|nr:SRPBCC family protein [Prevotella sp.]